MGNVLSGSSWTPCPVTGLAPAEKHSIRLTWALFKRNLREDGPAIFLVLFLRYPEYQKLFTPFANDDANALRVNPRLTAHALAVAYTLTSIIDNLDQPQTAVELVRKVANTHYGHSVKVYHFEHFSIVLIDVLMDKLGSHMTATATDSWTKLMSFLAKCVSSMYAVNEKEIKALGVQPGEKEGTQGIGSQQHVSQPQVTAQGQEASQQHEQKEHGPPDVTPAGQSVLICEGKEEQSPLAQKPAHIKRPPQEQHEPSQPQPAAQQETQPATQLQAQEGAHPHTQPEAQPQTRSQPQAQQPTLQQEAQPAAQPPTQDGAQPKTQPEARPQIEPQPQAQQPTVPHEPSVQQAEGKAT